MAPPRRQSVTISSALRRAELDARIYDADGHLLSNPTQKEIADAAGINPGTYSELRRHVNPRAVRFSDAIALAHGRWLSLEELVDADASGLLYERGGIRWRMSRVPRMTTGVAQRRAAALVLEGRSREQVEQLTRSVYSARGETPPVFTRAFLHELVQGGLARGLVTLELSELGREIEDEELAGELEEALAERAERGPSPRVRVVRNVADPSFQHDPVVPFMVARVAHDVVAEFLAGEGSRYTIGLAGGAHCSAFVRHIGPESTPFPGDRAGLTLDFVPLTLEPFRDHNLPLADAVVGRMVSTAREELGSERVSGYTLQTFGFVVEGRVDRLDEFSIEQVRGRYPNLDVAIFGCGDMRYDGWLEQLLRRVKPDSEKAPVTDACLHLLDEDGNPIPLEDGREFVGIGLADIRRLSANDRALALLLTSGSAKGLPLTVVARAGCADRIVCDQAAAREALAVLRGEARGMKQVRRTGRAEEEPA